MQLKISFEQLMELVRQLPHSEKVRISEELEKETLSNRLSSLLRQLHTDELEENMIAEEVEIVRQELYDRQQR